MIFDLFSIFTDTGKVDIVMDPLDAPPASSASLNAVDSWGTDKTATVNFDYATGDHSVANARRVVDMDDICNKLWYYLGPKIDMQHWRGNIVGTDPDSASPSTASTWTSASSTRGQENADRDLFTNSAPPSSPTAETRSSCCPSHPRPGWRRSRSTTTTSATPSPSTSAPRSAPPWPAASNASTASTVDIDTDGVERVSELMVSAQGFNPPDVPGDPVDPDDPSDGISKPVYHKPTRHGSPDWNAKPGSSSGANKCRADAAPTSPTPSRGELDRPDGGLRWYARSAGTIASIHASVGDTPRPAAASPSA